MTMLSHAFPHGNTGRSKLAGTLQRDSARERMTVEAMDLKLKFFGDAVDRLLTVDVSARGIISMLYEAARKRNNDRSLMMSAAQLFFERLSGGNQRTAIIATG